MTTQLLPYFGPGEQVNVTLPHYRGQVFVVKRTKRTKAIIVPATDLTARGLDCPLEYLVAATDEQGNRLPRVTLPTPQQSVTASDRPRPGALIRLNRPFRHWTTEDVLVVLSVNKTTVSAVKVGGEDNPGIRIGFGGFAPVDARTLTLAS